MSIRTQNGCNSAIARFRIHELSSNGVLLERITATFEYQCDGDGVLRGCVHHEHAATAAETELEQKRRDLQKAVDVVRRKFASAEPIVGVAFSASSSVADRNLGVSLRRDVEPRLMLCYAEELERKGGASGDMLLQIVVDERGTVESVQARLGSALKVVGMNNSLSGKLVECVQTKLRDLHFEPPEDGRKTIEAQASFRRAHGIGY